MAQYGFGSMRPLTQGGLSEHQKNVQQDWANRELIEIVTTSVKKMTDFLNHFGEFSSPSPFHEIAASVA
jgi:hypothetical protein